MSTMCEMCAQLAAELAEVSDVCCINWNEAESMRKRNIVLAAENNELRKKLEQLQRTPANEALS